MPSRRSLLAVGGDEDLGVADAGDDGALGLRGEHAGREGEGLVGPRDGPGNGDGFSHGGFSSGARLRSGVGGPVASSQSAILPTPMAERWATGN